MSSSLRTRSRAAVAACALLLLCTFGSVARASLARTWYVTNVLPCSPDGHWCGPSNEMREGAGNGTFPSGVVTIKDAESRVWIGSQAEASAADLGTRAWSLTIGGSSAVSRFTWTVGTWDWASGSDATFTAVGGVETAVTGLGTSTFRPSSALVVPAGRYVALRITGASGNGAPNSIDDYDEANGNSPSFLNLAAGPVGDVVIDSAPASVTQSTSATVTFHSPGAASYTCALDGTQAQACSSPVSYTNLPDRTHRLDVRASDGQTDGRASTVTWTVDSQPPTISLSGKPAAATRSTSAHFDFTASEQATFMCALDGAASAQCTTPFNGTVNTDGAHSFVIGATDAAGNAGSLTYNWMLDRVAPAAPAISAPLDGATVNGPLTTDGTAEPGSTVRAVADGVSVGTTIVPSSGAWTFTRALVAGSHVLHVTTTDAAGNLSPEVIRAFTIGDTAAAPPAPVLIAPHDGAVLRPDVLITGTAKAGTTVRLYEGARLLGTLTMGSGTAFSLQKTFGDGMHTVSATATDSVGGVSARAADVHFDVDATPPTVTVSTPDLAVFAIGTGSLEGGATDDRGVARVEVRYFDYSGTQIRAEVANCSGCGSPGAVTWTAPPDGPGYRTVQIDAVDRAGNISPVVKRTYIGR